MGQRSGPLKMRVASKLAILLTRDVGFGHALPKLAGTSGNTYQGTNKEATQLPSTIRQLLSGMFSCKKQNKGVCVLAVNVLPALLPQVCPFFRGNSPRCAVYSTELQHPRVTRCSSTIVEWQDKSRLRSCFHEAQLSYYDIQGTRVNNVSTPDTRTVVMFQSEKEK